MEKITPDMGIMEVVEKWPIAAEVLMEQGMGCLGCAAAHFESIGEGAAAHGMDVDALMEALNAAIAESAGQSNSRSQLGTAVFSRLSNG